MMFMRTGWLFLSLLLLGSLVMIGACSDGDETPDGATTEPSPTGPSGEFVITIGNISDMTGIAARAMEVVNTALEDLVRYYNEENLVPGVTFKALHYDAAYDPSNDIPGYQWLKDRNADVILAGLPSTPVTLKPLADDEHRIIFAMSAFPELEDPPGWVFSLNADTAKFGPTILRWIAENEWDYEANGPAKVGEAMWPGNYWTTLEEGSKAYCDAHPEQFEWIGAFVNPNTFSWTREIEALEEADYIFPPGSALATFTREYKLAEGKGKLIMTDAHVPFIGLTKETTGTEFMDGWYFLIPSRWWDEDYDVPNMVQDLLDRYHSAGEAQELTSTGGAYLTSCNQMYAMLNLLAGCVSDVGIEGFSQEALYDTATSFEFEYSGGQVFGYTPTERTAFGYEGMYRFDGDSGSLVRADAEWLPLVSGSGP